MKRFFKLFALFILLFCIAFAIFFVWASSPNLEEQEYAKTISKNYNQRLDTDSIYSIVTYNIGYLSGMTNNLPVAKPKSLFDNNLKKVLGELKKVNPDILAIQEIDYDSDRSYHVNQQKEIAKLGYNYIAEGVNWDERYVPFPYWPPSMHFGKIISGQSVLSKYSYSDYKRVVLERVKSYPFYRDALYLDRLAQVVKIKIEGKEVVVINVHLEAFDKETRIKQLDEVLTLFKENAKTNPVILLGDFNSDPSYKDAAISKITSMQNVGNAAFSDNKYELTFDTEKPFERLDYIFYTKNSIEYIDGRVLKEFEKASDHLPVMMHFKLK